MRRPLRPVRVRAAAIVLALLAHVLVLLLFSFGSRTPVREAVLVQFVSIWPAAQSVPIVEPTLVPLPPPTRIPALRNPAAPTPPVVIAPIEPSESEAPAPRESPQPSIDWYGEAAKSVARNAAKGDQPPTFSPPPKVLRGPCKPRKHSFEWNPEEKKAGLLPLPYFRVGGCMFMLAFFSCNLNGPPPANGHLFDDLQKGDRPVSSVPDPDTCD